MATKKKTTSRTTIQKAAANGPRKPAAGKAVARPARQSPAKSGALSMRSATPSFTVNDVGASLAFYRDVLGFAEGERWEEKGKLLGVEMLAGPVSFMLGQDDWKKGRDRDKGEGVRIYCKTDQNIDRVAERVKANGGTLSQEPRDEEWGGRAFSVEDPDGYKITISADLKR
jgi:uncharacterized glyoxalase superfamily protein PhnB